MRADSQEGTVTKNETKTFLKSETNERNESACVEDHRSCSKVGSFSHL